jgi:hypothetical protein
MRVIVLQSSRGTILRHNNMRVYLQIAAIRQTKKTVETALKREKVGVCCTPGLMKSLLALKLDWKQKQHYLNFR